MIRLINENCLGSLPKLNLDTVDLTVTSPPYDSLRLYNGIDDWGEHIWKPTLAELFRVTAPGGVVVWIVGDATVNGSETGTSFRQALYAIDCGFRLHDTMIWQKRSVPVHASHITRRYTQVFEYMFVFAKGKPRAVNLIRDRATKHAGQIATFKTRLRDGRFSEPVARLVSPFSCRYNIWALSVGGGRSSEEAYVRAHPAVFPEELARNHVLTWSNPGDTVLDPFMGSGTTGKAATLLGRSFVGIERDRQYFALAKRRIRESVGRPTAARNRFKYAGMQRPNCC